jgi:alpha-L-rhamnosidase
MFPGLVPGMLPMCYPMDPYEEDPNHYIPNWAMWFVLELEEYMARTGDKELGARMEPRIKALLEFFKRYENSDGLLEKLDAWVFVEWSKANDFVQDVNYPTNMLYAAALDAAARIYQNDRWAKKAATVRDTINRQSFDGTFYRDHAKRLPDGTLDIRPERTEVCQYYAFFCNTTTPDARPELWKTLVEEFGPARRKTKAHPEIFPCNQLPGNMLRMEILSRYGETARIHGEALGYWQMMAETTGTLWEHDQASASCNHGFASHAAVVLRRDILGLREIDHLAKTITFQMPANPLEHCRGSFPTRDGDIIVGWKRGETPQIKLPEGWKMKP